MRDTSVLSVGCPCPYRPSVRRGAGCSTFVSASGNRAAPIGVNESAAAFQALDDRQQQVIQALYNMLYHNALAIDEVKQEAQRLSEIYPLLQWFTSFFSRSARGIIR